MYLLDTNICIDYMRGRLPSFYEELRQSDPGLYKVPAIVAAELWHGAERSVAAEKNRRIVSQFLLPLEIVPFDEDCAVEYGRIRTELEHEGRVIGPNNLLIAATARARSAVLVTNNAKEFRRVRGLIVESRAELSF